MSLLADSEGLDQTAQMPEDMARPVGANYALVAGMWEKWEVQSMCESEESDLPAYSCSQTRVLSFHFIPPTRSIWCVSNDLFEDSAKSLYMGFWGHIEYHINDSSLICR